VSLVLDGSATLAWVYPDEVTPQIVALFDQAIVEGAIVPQLWKIEIANSLSNGIRRKRIDFAGRAAALSDLDAMFVTVDLETGEHVWQETLSLADRHNLTVYDATYLELALRLSLPLATLDDDLRHAAQQEGVSLLGR
jgi:predicted nucleic acid-binding protein